MQELEKILKEIENERADIDDYSDAKGRMLARHWNNCIDVVEEIIRKHMNDGWISVDKNNIPEDEILACDGYKNELIGYLRYNPDGEEFICESDECIMHQVTAWMPRPEPYKPERSEGE